MAGAVPGLRKKGGYEDELAVEGRRNKWWPPEEDWGGGGRGMRDESGGRVGPLAVPGREEKPSVLGMAFGLDDWADWFAPATDGWSRKDWPFRGSRKDRKELLPGPAEGAEAEFGCATLWSLDADVGVDMCQVSPS